jgi:flagellin
LGLRIATNMQTMQANRQLGEVTSERRRTLERLSSGERIVRSGDDAAGMSISEKLKGGIRSMQMAQRNTQDGISMVQTAEGGITEAQNILLRMRELSMVSASDTVGGEERGYVNMEFQHLKDEIRRIANTTIYDRKHLLNGTGPTIDFQVGIDNSANDRLSYTIPSANILPGALGIESLSANSKQAAQGNLAVIDSAIGKLSESRSSLGAMQTQLSHQMHNLDVSRTNHSAGNSRIRDADMAEWAAKNVAQSIRQEAGNAVLVQARDIPKAAIRLLEAA